MGVRFTLNKPGQVRLRFRLKSRLLVPDELLRAGRMRRAFWLLTPARRTQTSSRKPEENLKRLVSDYSEAVRHPQTLNS